jgi:hypothetical protein
LTDLDFKSLHQAWQWSFYKYFENHLTFIACLTSGKHRDDNVFTLILTVVLRVRYYLVIKVLLSSTLCHFTSSSKLIHCTCTYFSLLNPLTLQPHHLPVGQHNRLRPSTEDGDSVRSSSNLLTTFTRSKEIRWGATVLGFSVICRNFKATEANRRRGPGTREKVSSRRINLECNICTGKQC